MENLTGYHELSCNLQRELVNHGYGEMRFFVTSLKDNTVKIEIQCGKSFVFFIKKELTFQSDSIL